MKIKMDQSCFMSPEELEKYKDLYISPDAIKEIEGWCENIDPKLIDEIIGQYNNEDIKLC